jgi:protein disulfide-isomerase
MMVRVLVLAALIASSCAAEDSAWLRDFEAAKKAAAEKNVPILANFSGSDWCIWCKRLDKEVFSTPEFKEYASTNLVLFIADFPRKDTQPAEIRDQNSKLAEQNKVNGFPTVLLFDAKGTVLGRTGYKQGGPKKYIENLKGLLAGKKSADGD